MFSTNEAVIFNFLFLYDAFYDFVGGGNPRGSMQVVYHHQCEEVAEPISLFDNKLHVVET